MKKKTIKYISIGKPETMQVTWNSGKKINRGDLISHEGKIFQVINVELTLLRIK